MFAFSSLKYSKWARNYYDKQRSRSIPPAPVRVNLEQGFGEKGKTNSVALRSSSDRLLRKIFFLWKNEVIYDENVAQKNAA